MSYEWRVFAAFVRGSAAEAILRVRAVGHPRHGIDSWHARRSWAWFSGATPTIADVSESAAAVAQRWRDGAGLVEFKMPLWIVVRADGAELVEVEPPHGTEAVRVRQLEEHVARELAAFVVGRTTVVA